MKLGKIIRKYRKEAGLTQEEMANRLGVTAPAVNKWENDNSLPDLTLIAPICRLLGITPDLLLSFREELTPEEIALFIQELNEKLKTEDYSDVFSFARQKLEQYPSCEQLLWQTALVLDGWRKTHDIPHGETYDEYLCACYTRALESEDETFRSLAADSLFGFYITKENYEKAEALLPYFSKENPERKRKQAFLYSKMNRIEDAYRAYEELLLTGYQMLSMVFQSLYRLSLEANDNETAAVFVEKQTRLAELFEMGAYHELSCQFDYAVETQDADAIFSLLENMLESLPEVTHFQKSFLYAHIPFRKLDAGFTKQLRDLLLESLKKEENFSFLRQDARWESLFAAYERHSFKDK